MVVTTIALAGIVVLYLQGHRQRVNATSSSPKSGEQLRCTAGCRAGTSSRGQAGRAARLPHVCRVWRRRKDGESAEARGESRCGQVMPRG